MYIFIIPAAAVLLAFLISGFRITRPTHRGVVETFGRYSGFVKPGLHWIIPGMQKIHTVRVTEQTLNLDPQLMTTKDNMNVIADAHIYIKVKTEKESIKASLYNADDCIRQTVETTRTVIRDIVASMPLRRIYGQREQIGTQMCKTLNSVVENWGVEVVRCDLKEVELPKDVQVHMHKLVKAEHEKLAASDFAAAAELNADGIRRAEIKKAEGAKQARILAAEAEAEAMRITSHAAKQYYFGNARRFRLLEAVEKTLKDNTKIVVIDPVTIFDKLSQFDKAIDAENSAVKINDLLPAQSDEDADEESRPTQ